jgi:hypothetical protein
MKKDSLIIILFILIVLIYLYHNKFEKFDTTEEESNGSSSTGQEYTPVVVQEQITVDTTLSQNLPVATNQQVTIEYKYITVIYDGKRMYLDYSVPVGMIVNPVKKLHFVEESKLSETSKFGFVSGSRYIRTHDNKFIKVNSLDPSKIIVSDSELMETDSNPNIVAYWSPLLYDALRKVIYFETAPSNVNTFSKCYLNVLFDNNDSTFKWNYCDPINLPVLTSQATSLMLLNA